MYDKRTGRRLSVDEQWDEKLARAAAARAAEEQRRQAAGAHAKRVIDGGLQQALGDTEATFASNLAKSQALFTSAMSGDEAAAAAWKGLGRVKEKEKSKPETLAELIGAAVGLDRLNAAPDGYDLSEAALRLKGRDTPDALLAQFKSELGWLSHDKSAGSKAARAAALRKVFGDRLIRLTTLGGVRREYRYKADVALAEAGF